MRTWIRLGLAAFVMVVAFMGVRMVGDRTILLEDIQAERSHGETVVVTMKIRNSGKADRLINVKSNHAEVSIVSTDSDQLPIPAETTVSLGTEAAFIAFKDIQGSAEEGRLIPFVLNFENAGAVNAKARVVNPVKTNGEMDHSAMGGTEHAVPEGEVEPTLSLTALPRAEGGFVVGIETTGFEFSREKADGPHQAGIGHGHLYIGGVKIGRVYGDSAVIPALPAGKHKVRVTLNTNDHRTYVVDENPVTAVVIVGE